jgi:hypothetical protein
VVDEAVQGSVTRSNAELAEIGDGIAGSIVR